jgi:hypothetical protein
MSEPLSDIPDVSAGEELLLERIPSDEACEQRKPILPPPLPSAVLMPVVMTGPPPLLPVRNPTGPPPLPAPLPPPQSLLGRIGWTLGRIVQAIGSALEWLFGLAVLLVGLAALAGLPILGLFSLGYLLEAGARVARTGRLREAFIGVRLAARLGGIVVASWLLLLPVRFVSDIADSARIIEPGGPIARAWRLGLLVLIVLTALHILAACARGGRLRWFLWPFNGLWLLRRLWRGGYFAEARDAVWDSVMALRLPYYFWLGLRGFVGGLLWLAIPVTLLALGSVPAPVAPLIGWLGAVLLGIVLLYLPFLQIHMAAENRFAALFEVGTIRADFQRAPWLFCLAFTLTLALALPLYLLKIEIVPAEAAWLPGLFFVAFIYPARVMTGWALACARHRPQRSHWFFRWTGWLPLLPVTAFYVLIVYFSQFTSWNGIASLYEQHAFLLPVPFLGL